MEIWKPQAKVYFFHKTVGHTICRIKNLSEYRAVRPNHKELVGLAVESQCGLYDISDNRLLTFPL